MMLASAQESRPLPYNDKSPQRYDLTKRASELDQRAKPHPEINFLFEDNKGKVLDLQHATVDTRVAPQGKLVIWLMNHNGGLFERVASYGLHGIQVHYANGWFGGLSKEVRDNGNSLGNIRLEAATGEDFSPHVEIPPVDSLKERSVAFVRWLVRNNPQGKWRQFLSTDGKDLQWDKVILAGASHGSTTAARFALHQKVDRVVMFCGPRDNTETWQGLPSATPSNRFFGFSHVLDGGWTADHYCRSWQLLGLHKYGEIINVDKVASPYGNSRRLVTDFDVKKDANRAHSSVTPGGSAGKDAEGKLIHEDVWRYLFLHPVDQVGDAVEAESDCNLDPH